MAKDRNTFAKRQREMERKRKADQKRERRAKKKQESNDGHEPHKPETFLTPAEEAVLNIFRKYLMTPGKMLCLGSSDLNTYNEPLTQLADRGLIVAERFQGGFSLTDAGFAAMKNGE